MVSRWPRVARLQQPGVLCAHSLLVVAIELNPLLLIDNALGVIILLPVCAMALAIHLFLTGALIGPAHA